jgi:hypothetical protein
MRIRAPPGRTPLPRPGLPTMSRAGPGLWRGSAMPGPPAALPRTGPPRRRAEPNRSAELPRGTHRHPWHTPHAGPAERTEPPPTRGGARLPGAAGPVHRRNRPCRTPWHSHRHRAGFSPATGRAQPLRGNSPRTHHRWTGTRHTAPWHNHPCRAGRTERALTDTGPGPEFLGAGDTGRAAARAGPLGGEAAPACLAVTGGGKPCACSGRRVDPAVPGAGRPGLSARGTHSVRCRTRGCGRRHRRRRR